MNNANTSNVDSDTFVKYQIIKPFSQNSWLFTKRLWF